MTRAVSLGRNAAKRVQYQSITARDPEPEVMRAAFDVGSSGRRFMGDLGVSHTQNRTVDEVKNKRRRRRLRPERQRE